MGNSFKIAIIGFDAKFALYGNIIKIIVINAQKANKD